jgi:hypothetical protein
VLGLTPPWAPFRAGAGAVARKEQALWLNRPRNALLAKVADACARRDTNALLECGLDVPPWPGGGDEVLRVAVLVESPPHARALQKLLLGWTVWTGVNEEAGGANAAPPAMLILTLVRAAGLAEETAFDVVINASSEGPVTFRWLVSREATGAGCILIEVLDEADARARRLTAERLAWYRRAGMAVECHAPPC